MVEVYSIDESFFRLPVLPSGLGDVKSAHVVREDILRSVGLPTRIGLGPTRTLSKVANALAKATEKVWGGVVDLHDVELRRRLFEHWPVSEVWGIGRALEARLRPLGIKTTADLAALPPAVARDVGTVVLERLVRELGGVECDDFKITPEPSKATAVTRQFGEPVTDPVELREAMARRAARGREDPRPGLSGGTANRLRPWFTLSSQSALCLSHDAPVTTDQRSARDRRNCGEDDGCDVSAWRCLYQVRRAAGGPIQGRGRANRPVCHARPQGSRSHGGNGWDQCTLRSQHNRPRCTRMRCPI